MCINNYLTINCWIVPEPIISLNNEELCPKDSYEYVHSLNACCQSDKIKQENEEWVIADNAFYQSSSESRETTTSARRLHHHLQHHHPYGVHHGFNSYLYSFIHTFL